VDTTCEKCGKTITGRMKANVWKGEMAVCTDCLHILKGAELRKAAAYRIAGQPFTAWLVHDGQQQLGPFTTEEMIDLLGSNQLDWMWNIWRHGMANWTPAARLFTIPELSEGRLELRNHGQGDGTYNSPSNSNPPPMEGY
jgi:hypothetical protein